LSSFFPIPLPSLSIRLICPLSPPLISHAKIIHKCQAHTRQSHHSIAGGPSRPGFRQLFRGTATRHPFPPISPPVNSPRTVSWSLGTSLGIPLVYSSHNKDTRERNKDSRGGNPVASILNAFNFRFLSQRPNLEVTPFLLRDDDTARVVYAPCAGSIRSETKEDRQHDLMRMIGIFSLHSFSVTPRF